MGTINVWIVHLRTTIWKETLMTPTNTKQLRESLFKELFEKNGHRNDVDIHEAVDFAANAIQAHEQIVRREERELFENLVLEQTAIEPMNNALFLILEGLEALSEGNDKGGV